MKKYVLPIDDPHSMNEMFFTTLPTRIFESKDMWVMPGGTLFLGGDATPRWKEVHQIVQLQTIGLSPTTAYYNWHLSMIAELWGTARL